MTLKFKHSVFSESELKMNEMKEEIKGKNDEE